MQDSMGNVIYSVRRIELYRLVTTHWPGWRNQPLDLLHVRVKNQECLGRRLEGFLRMIICKGKVPNHSHCHGFGD